MLYYSKLEYSAATVRKCFKNPRGPSASLASICAPPLRDAFQNRVFTYNIYFPENRVFTLFVVAAMVAALHVQNHLRGFFRAPPTYI